VSKFHHYNNRGSFPQFPKVNFFPSPSKQILPLSKKSHPSLLKTGEMKINVLHELYRVAKNMKLILGRKKIYFVSEQDSLF
jgi:hypothetical protein